MSRGLPCLLAVGMCSGLALAQIPEIEPNDNKAQATVANLDCNMFLEGITFGSVTSPYTGASNSADYWRIITRPQPLGIYRYRLIINSQTPGHTGTIRGLSQAGGVIAAGTDIAVQTSSATTVPPRFNQWYGFGKSEHIFYRITGTTATSAVYIVSLDCQPVVPPNIGVFQAGPIEITTVGLTGTDTDLWIYDSGLNAIANYGNDDEGGGASSQSRLLRNYAPGRYYIAVSDFNFANNLPSNMADENYQNGNVMDFPDSAVCSSNVRNLSVSTKVSDSFGNSVVVPSPPATKVDHFDIVWLCFDVIAPTEACCFPSGVCVDLAAGLCQQQGGSPQGPGSSCATVHCPTPAACCFCDGSCLDLPVSSCTAQGGLVGPSGSGCATYICPRPGACCVTGGGCVFVAEWCCSGVFLGAGVGCTPNPCLTQACCLPNGTCSDTSMTLCISAGGQPQGVGTNCANTICRQACCRPDGSCVDIPVSQCTTTGGQPQGLGSTCANTTCPQACCLSTACIDTSPANCLAQGGTPQGPGTTCANINSCRQACCLQNGACNDLPYGVCIAQGGAPQGVNTFCATTICTQACCFLNGACLNLTPPDCQAQGGAPQGPGTNCATTTCPVVTSGCCLPNGSCVNLPTNVCIGQGGTPQVTPCAGIQCPSNRCQGVLVGDANCDGSVNNFDIQFFVFGVLSPPPPDASPAPAGYLAIGGTQACWNVRRCWGDVNCDGLFNNFDIDPFVACILAPPPPGIGCPSCAPRACCLPGPVCVDLLPAACAIVGGTPQAGLCGGIVCP